MKRKLLGVNSYDRTHDITPEEVRRFEKYRHYTDEQVAALIDTIKRYTRFIYNVVSKRQKSGRKIALLEKYDPTVKKSSTISDSKSGVGAKRKVIMLDGKNWFEEKITTFQPNQALAYQLTDCSFPINGLKHSYSFEMAGSQTRVKQVMEYTVKFGLLGKLLDNMMIRKQTESGIKKFFSGLKSYAETH